MKWMREWDIIKSLFSCLYRVGLHTIFLEGKKAVVIPSYTSDWVTWREIWHNFGKWKIPLIFLFFFRTKIVLWHLFYELRPILIEWKSQNTNSFDKIKENKDAQNVYVVIFKNSKIFCTASLPNSTYDYPSFMTKGCLFCRWHHSSCAFFRRLLR